MNASDAPAKRTHEVLRRSQAEDYSAIKFFGALTVFAKLIMPFRASYSTFPITHPYYGFGIRRSRASLVGQLGRLT
jgi:hypothetical protein